jgi:predicted metal-dependent hydrolase
MRWLRKYADRKLQIENQALREEVDGQKLRISSLKALIEEEQNAHSLYRERWRTSVIDEAEKLAAQFIRLKTNLEGAQS